MMSLERFVERIPEFDSWAHAQRIRFFAWYLHRHESKPRFQITDIRRLYVAMSMAGPGNYSQQVTDLLDAEVLLKDSAGLFLEKKVRDEFDKKYGEEPERIAVRNLLASLPERVPNLAERVFVKEALDCYSVKAFRAAVVMAWNLAYDHLCAFVLAHHRDEFNARWPLRFPDLHKKARIKTIEKVDDFAELQENEVILICRSAGLISADVERTLARGLGRRNSAAHPSGVAIEQLQAEECIDDLVKNVVLKLKT